MLLILNGHLYVSGVWLRVNLRMGTYNEIGYGIC